MTSITKNNRAKDKRQTIKIMLLNHTRIKLPASSLAPSSNLPHHLDPLAPPAMTFMAAAAALRSATYLHSRLS